jgi:hypothetical protein
MIIDPNQTASAQLFEQPAITSQVMPNNQFNSTTAISNSQVNQIITGGLPRVVNPGSYLPCPMPVPGRSESGLSQGISQLMLILQNMIAMLQGILGHNRLGINLPGGDNRFAPPPFSQPYPPPGGGYYLPRPVDREKPTIIPLPKPISPGQPTVIDSGSNTGGTTGGVDKPSSPSTPVNGESDKPSGTTTKKPNIGSALKKTGEFLWKPVSESDGKLAIVLPKELTGKVKEVRVLSPDGKKSLAKGRFSGVANGDREHYRFSKPGAQYPDGAIVIITLENGSKRYVKIKDSSARSVK